MSRSLALLALASLTLGSGLLGCGARSELLEQTSAPTEIYVADSQASTGGSGRIVRVADMNGKGWAEAPLSYEKSFVSPCGPAVGSDGAIYFADVGGSRIFTMKDMTGAGLTPFGPPGPDPSTLTLPTGVALDGDDHIHVADTGANRVVRVDDISGAGFVAFGTFGSGKGQLSGPQGIAVSSKGQILIADFGNHRIVQIDDMSGSGWAEWPVPGGVVNPSAPFGVAYDSADRIYAVDFNTPTLHRIDSIAGDNHVELSAPELSQASHVAVGPDGRIYVTILNVGHAIARMDDMDGSGLVVYGSEGSGTGQFQNPCGIFVK